MADVWCELIEIGHIPEQLNDQHPYEIEHNHRENSPIPFLPNLRPEVGSNYKRCDRSRYSIQIQEKFTVSKSVVEG